MPAWSSGVQRAVAALTPSIGAEPARDVVLAVTALAIAAERAAPVRDALRRTGDATTLQAAADAGLGGLFLSGARALAGRRLDLRPVQAEIAQAVAAAHAASIPGWVLLGLVHEAMVDARGAGDGPTEISARRRWGSHYTPLPLAHRVIEVALDRLPASRLGSATICDPAMGGGIFVIAAGKALAGRTGQPFAAIAPRSFGIDRDARAVDVARFALHVAAGSPDEPVDHFGRGLVVGDALLPPPAGLDWAQAFPSVHGDPTDRRGFDLIVGNPPFVGGKRIATHLGAAYARALRQVHPDASGNTDLSAHFFRRAFDRLADGGIIGFITTSGIAKGDTREGGLAVLVARGATIVAAERARAWPGDASVRISIVHVAKTASPEGPRMLDGREVQAISAFLEEGDASAAPARRPENRGLAFVGCYLRGMGFTFDDQNAQAMPLALRDRLIEDDPSLASRVPPYLGGDEIARHPQQRPHRFVLDLNDLVGADEARFPHLFALARKYVKPGRDALGSSPIDRSHRERFHCWANARPELRKATAGLARILVTPRVSTRRFFAFLPAGVVPSEQLVVFALPTYAAFAVLQSLFHDVWARTFGSSMGLGVRYTPSDVFETFPLPAGFRDDPALEQAGKELYEARAETCTRHGLGLADLYASLAERPDLVRLHRRVDEAVAQAYGFSPEVLVGVERGGETSAPARRLVSRLRAISP